MVLEDKVLRGSLSPLHWAKILFIGLPVSFLFLSRYPTWTQYTTLAVFVAVPYLITKRFTITVSSSGFARKLIRNRFTAWPDTENFRAYYNGPKSGTFSIVWSHSDALRKRFDKEPLMFAAYDSDETMWAYWDQYSPKETAALMNQYRESYRHRNNEPAANLQVWLREKCHLTTQSS
jgi:hypothetical protein